MTDSAQQGITVSPETLRALAREIAAEMDGGRNETRVMARLNEISEELRGEIHAIQLGMADGARRMETLERRGFDHSGRLETLEKQVSSAGLEDIAGVRKLIFRLGLAALAALCCFLVGLGILAPYLVKAIK